jgi:acyl-CoA synthetase (AMP-forming)/AMP-acid ligase II
MLYEAWREIVGKHAGEAALRDIASGGKWSFQELDSLAGGGSSEPVIFPQGPALEFIVSTLKAWKGGAVVCPLEPGQHRPEVVPPPGHIVHLKTTSATTGPPRLVALTSKQLMADAQNIVETMGLRREWPNLGVISLAHSYGFSNLITPLLLHGIPLIVTGSTLPETIRSALQQAAGVTLAGVPALWRAWFEAGALEAKRVRLAISAGAPLPLALETEIFERCRIKIHNFYGSSECGGIAYDDSHEPRVNPACIGPPMTNVAVGVAEDGCLEVRSGAVAETYWPDSDERLAGGRFRTSDLAEIIGGQVYLRGRASDVINVAGRKVLPEIIEGALARHASVRQCVVFGVTEGDRERIVACIALDRATSAEDLKQFLLAHLPSWQVPRDFWFIDDLLTDQRGKLSRAAWRTKYLARQGS